MEGTMKNGLRVMAAVLAAALAAPVWAHDVERTSEAQMRRAQEKLTKLGYPAGTADGAMGEETRNAIRNFQRDKGLNATGELNDETVAALDLGRAERAGRATSADIRRAQERLATLGYRPGRADGRMGERTATALRNFQRDRNLNATGELDEDTVDALDEERAHSTAGTRAR